MVILMMTKREKGNEEGREVRRRRGKDTRMGRREKPP